MTKRDGESLFKGTLFERAFEKAVELAPRQHSAFDAAACLSFRRMVEARGEHFDVAEKRHILLCRRCTQLVASEWWHGGCPSARLVESREDWAKAALDTHLERDRCLRCRLILGLAEARERFGRFAAPALQGAFAREPVERLHSRYESPEGLIAELQETSDHRVEVTIQTRDVTLDGREVRIEIRGESVAWSATAVLERVDPIGCVARHDFGDLTDLLPRDAAECVFAVSLAQ